METMKDEIAEKRKKAFIDNLKLNKLTLEYELKRSVLTLDAKVGLQKKIAELERLILMWEHSELYWEDIMEKTKSALPQIKDKYLDNGKRFIEIEYVDDTINETIKNLYPAVFKSNIRIALWKLKGPKVEWVMEGIKENIL